jgi:hypothetical protein
MKIIAVFCRMIRIAALALDLYAVPLAAALLGWQPGGRFFLWAPGAAAVSSDIYHALATSPLYVYTARIGILKHFSPAPPGATSQPRQSVSGSMLHLLAFR